ncbi:MAG: L-2-amino-thiazoline-4-carboxylic acid hydrolase [Lachnospiraceae bacterium]|nr:L-2-amino-thiazoline-4-carboxylic acid hydrolase [Lachnospiraceae bacterium]
MSQKDIDNFVAKMDFDTPISQEDFKSAVKSAYMDRARQVWFIYKKIKELYPEVDAERIIREGSWDFGLYQGNKIAEKYGAENIGPKEALFGQTSKGGMLVFEQEIKEADDEKAVKHFNACPHCEAIRELGATPEEIRAFCRDMIGACDYAIVHPFPHVEIDFPTTVADGKGEPCRMTITRKKNKTD